MTHLFNTTLYPPGATDPPAFVNYVQFAPACTFSPLIGCPNTPDSTTPSYIVLDRVYAYGQPWPSREMGCFYPGGNHWAIINSYCSVNYWVQGIYPQANPTSARQTIYIPNSYFQFNGLDNNQIGMKTPAGLSGTSSTSLNVATGTQSLTTQAGLSYTTGSLVEILSTINIASYMIGTVASYSSTTGYLTANILSSSGLGTFSSWRLVAPATFSVPANYSGSVYAWVGSTGVVIDYQSAPGDFTCRGCTSISEPSPARHSVPAASLYYFNGSFSSGSWNLLNSTPSAVNPSIFTAFRPMGIYIWPGRYGVFDNNFIQAIGQTVYNDTLGTFEDMSWTHNHFFFPRSKMKNSGQWDGYGYSFRNVIESKQQLRGQYIGNIIDGSASYQNPGNALYIAGSYAGPFSTGTQDINIRGNIFRHLSSGFQIAGGGAASPPDSPTALRIGITNNFWLDLNRDLYNNGGGGLASGSFSAYPMVSDINFSNNTVGLTRGSGPSLLLFGGASEAGTTTMGEGLLYSNNVVLASLGGLDTVQSIDGGQNPLYSNFPAKPAVPAGSPYPAPAGTWANYLNRNWIHTAATLTPSWSMGNNVIIGAQNNRGQTVGAWIDLTPAQITSSLEALWPSSDTTTRFPCSSTDTRCSATTMAARLAAIGWSPTLDLADGNPNTYRIVPSTYNAGNLGADVTTTNQAAGIIQEISVNHGSTFVRLNYIAPDTRGCSADIRAEGATWTRLADTGGGLARSITFTGLRANTTYQYRLMCYFDQTLAFEFLASQVTSGSFKTAEDVVRTLVQDFTLPPGADRAIFTFASASASTVNQTCSASPCELGLQSGNWTRTVTFESNAAIVIGTPSVTNINVP